MAYNDTIAPVSNMAPLSPGQSKNWWKVSWEGSDNSSGMDHYQIDYRAGLNTPWIHWLDTTGFFAFFSDAIPNQAYYFRVTAYDRAGNVERHHQPYDTLTVAGEDTSGLNLIYAPLVYK